MPQLLAYLGVDEDDPSAPDWGTIAVFSCAASCAPAPGQGGDGSAYAEEFCWVQPPASSA
jgi:pre-rRNA-processing protein TSR4